MAINEIMDAAKEYRNIHESKIEEFGYIIDGEGATKIERQFRIEIDLQPGSKRHSEERLSQLKENLPNKFQYNNKNYDVVIRYRAFSVL